VRPGVGDRFAGALPHPDVFEIFVVVGADAGRSGYHFEGTLSITKPVSEVASS
jgi:hypothetical protein